MTEHSHLQSTVEQIQQIMENAEGQLTESKRNESGNAEEFTNAQMQLEEANMELERMIASATNEQRDQLFRLQQRLQHLQNKMILGI
ncbi:chromosome segregation ATPase [Evansella vedderi]|uniref:Chromosome segregation ATPase n=1 Tax=Evansella vedderi TaxID=38282 RepID=A0ABT9ZWB5_9BACI|nr:DUF2524 family protein [Evansella vedderi]MDQ0255245.1 chromosome segregation ATPase [Evansella vedderi]